MPGIGQQQPTFQFGVFELNPRTGELRKHGVRLKLQEQPLQILSLLLEHAGELVTREELQERLWPEGTYVDFDNAINSAIRKLRETLGDTPENPRFVETLARRGYRFIAPVSRTVIHDSLREEGPLPKADHPAPPPFPQADASKRRLWWVGSALAVVLVATGMGLRWWAARSDEARRETPLPAVPLTGNPGNEGFPTFSPEGTRVAFAWAPPGTNVANLYVKLLGPGDPVRLTKNSAGYDFAPAWSPDGRTIGFLRTRDPSHSAIMVIPSVGGPEQELAQITFEAHMILNNGFGYEIPPPFLAWSKDSRWLLSLDRKAPSETSSILRVSVETGEKRILTYPSSRMQGDGGLALSPDGKVLAFTRAVGPFESDIYLVSLSVDMAPRGEPQRLTFDGKEIDCLAWTADGHSLIFSSKRGGRRELWQMPVMPSGAPVRLTAAGDDPRDVAIARVGQHLVYSHQVLDWNVWRLTLHGKSKEEPSNLIASTRLEYHARYSPDAKRIAFESNRSGNEEIWICQADGSHPIQLTAFHNTWAGSPSWSPDGQKIAFDSNAAGNWDIYVIRSQGGQPSRLTTSETSEFKPTWSHDGKWIYYCSTRTGHEQVWKIPASGGSEVQVTKNGGGAPFESVDGEELYYANEDGLWKMPVRGGREIRVLESLLLKNFAPTKHGVYFIERLQESNTAPSLKLLDFTTHAIRTIASVPGPLGDAIDVSPDERWMLWNRADRQGSELMIIENFR